MQLDNFFLLYEIMFFIESHDTLLTIERSDESFAVTFEMFVSSLSSHSYPLLKSPSFSSLVGLASLTFFFFSLLFSGMKSSLFLNIFCSTVHCTLTRLSGQGYHSYVLRVAFTCFKVYLKDSVSNAVHV